MQTSTYKLGKVDHVSYFGGPFITSNNFFFICLNFSYFIIHQRIPFSWTFNIEWPYYSFIPLLSRVWSERQLINQCTTKKPFGHSGLISPDMSQINGSWIGNPCFVSLNTLVIVTNDSRTQHKFNVVNSEKMFDKKHQQIIPKRCVEFQ